MAAANTGSHENQQPIGLGFRGLDSEFVCVIVTIKLANDDRIETHSDFRISFIIGIVPLFFDNKGVIVCPVKSLSRRNVAGNENLDTDGIS